MRLDLIMRRCYDPFSTAVILGSIAGGFGVSKVMESQKNQAAKASRANDAAAQQNSDKLAAEQKALQDTQEEDKKKAAARLALSTSGFSRETNTARSFLTTF